MNDLARSIGFSKAYIYKFFDSKQAIGEAICQTTLAVVLTAAEKELLKHVSSSEKFKGFFKTLVEKNVQLFFVDRRLYDIAAHASADRWLAAETHMEQLSAILRQIIMEGRENGEFERKTPIDETCRVIFQVMQPYLNPLMLQHNLDTADTVPLEISNLVLRSLSP